MFQFTRTHVDDRQIDYAAFPDDIHFEIRSRCTESARIFLAMTCKREYDSRQIVRSYLLHALAYEKENYLVEVGLKYFTDQHVQDIHDINHFALDAMNLELYRFLVNHPFMRTNHPCRKCLEYTVRTGNKDEIINTMELYDTHSTVNHPANIWVTSEAICIANVPLVQWLLDTKRFASEIWLNSKISTRVDPLNWFEMMGIVKKHIGETGYSWLRNKLFDLINLQRKWSFQQIFSFVTIHERELDEIEDIRHISLDVRMGLRWEEFLVSAIECKNRGIYKQVWECLIDNGDTFSIDLAWTHLAIVDDAQCSIGILLFPSMDSVHNSRMPRDSAICRDYYNTLRGVLQSLQ